MKSFIFIVAACSVALPLFGQEKSPQLKDQKDKVSYSIGLNIGSNLSKQNIPINPDVLATGIKKALRGKPQFKPDQVKESWAELEKIWKQKKKQGRKKKA